MRRGVFNDTRRNVVPRTDRSNINGHRDLNPGTGKVGTRFLRTTSFAAYFSHGRCDGERRAEIYPDRLSRRDGKSGDESATCDRRLQLTLHEIRPLFPSFHGRLSSVSRLRIPLIPSWAKILARIPDRGVRSSSLIPFRERERDFFFTFLRKIVEATAGNRICLFLTAA